MKSSGWILWGLIGNGLILVGVALEESRRRTLGRILFGIGIGLSLFTLCSTPFDY